VPPPAPFVPAVGSYSGLFFEPAGIRYLASGAFTLTTTGLGSYSGSLQLGATSYKFTGLFDSSGVGSNTLPRSGTNSLIVQFQMDAVDNGRIVGTVNGGTWIADLDAERVLTYPKTNPAPWLGKYTLIFPGSGIPADASRPLGDGYAAVSVDGTGLAKFTGALADGTAVARSSKISRFGQCPLYVPLTGPAQVLGWLTFSNAAADGVGGAFDWLKLPNAKAKMYRPGFDWSTNVIGSVLQSAAVPALNFTNGVVVIAGGNLAIDLTNPVQFIVNKVTNLGTNALSLKLTTTTGVFKGTDVNPATRKSLAIQGVILQKQNYGSGYFLGTNQSGRVYFGP